MGQDTIVAIKLEGMEGLFNSGQLCSFKATIKPYIIVSPFSGLAKITILDKWR